MSRRRRAEKREILPDAKFGNRIVTKFINCVMVNGKKSTAEKVVYCAIEILSKKRKNENSLELFVGAINAVKPAVEVKSRRVGGATYQVPVEVREPRATALAIRWIINAALARSEKTMIDRLAGELFDITESRGAALKKRDDTHRMADANRAFAHFARMNG